MSGAIEVHMCKEKNLFDRATGLLHAHLAQYGMDLNSAGADVVKKMLDEMVIAALKCGYPFDPGVEFSIIPGEDVYHFVFCVHFKTGKYEE